MLWYVCVGGGLLPHQQEGCGFEPGAFLCICVHMVFPRLCGFSSQSPKTCRLIASSELAMGVNVRECLLISVSALL